MFLGVCQNGTAVNLPAGIDHAVLHTSSKSTAVYTSYLYMIRGTQQQVRSELSPLCHTGISVRGAPCVVPRGTISSNMQHCNTTAVLRSASSIKHCVCSVHRMIYMRNLQLWHIRTSTSIYIGYQYFESFLLHLLVLVLVHTYDAPGTSVRTHHTCCRVNQWQSHPAEAVLTPLVNAVKGMGSSNGNR